MHGLLTNYTVLIAEDDSNSKYLLEEFLKETGLNIIHVSCGEEVINFLDKDNKPDLILMDMKMPGINGYDTSVEIKKRNINIPIIAQTASAFSERFLINNKDIFEDYILKPYQKEDLINKIMKILIN